MKKALPIGQAAAQSGVQVPTIRYYEQIGLLPSPLRSEGNRRLYSEAEIRRLAFIRHARELGFGVDAIRALLALQDNPQRSCTEADVIARARLADVEHRIASLTALRKVLRRMITACAGGSVSECMVVEMLAENSQLRNPKKG
ncbi:MerR family transcriptional regulator [Phreatobacter oligotrophus]|uniref:MerR family transcriptional regulator n=1 Tax=Phreatobacter oligotrophus TaxID=1122261 RepID=A0A2T4ZFE1_9HYPH|nr:helix-turn-helix domain-containing protein [Phreatobacter oligotrophus]PTM60619.1 MerR family transcriptional regulator [Phreatobacter oligotrophus]